MRTLKITGVIAILLSVIISFSALQAFATENSKTETIKTPTVQCGMCKNRIEKALDKIDGIKSVDVDYDKKITTVKYDPDKISIQEVEKAIADTGYKAGDTEADKKAYSKLPKCCKMSEDR